MATSEVSTAKGGAIFTEGRRQLAICNACRYCAGYCPVWPAMERHPSPSREEMEQLANLCHDCRDCYTACMYTPPHEFALNPPKLFAEIREETYDRYIFPFKLPRAISGIRGLLLIFILCLLSLFGIGYFFGTENWLTTSSGQIYDVFGHVALVLVMSACLIYGLVVTTVGTARFWHAIRTEGSSLFNFSNWRKTVSDILVLRHMSGGQEGCSYVGGEPSSKRKVGHQLLMYGFIGTFLATVCAAFMQYVLGMMPPYSLLSVPVILGSVGGLAALIGSIILMALKPKTDRKETTERMWQADHSLLGGLMALMLSGFLVTIFRGGAVFPSVLVLHIAMVETAFLVFPRTKFVHLFFRAISIYQDNLEVRAHMQALQAKNR
ncbi:tricarballylate utilization 4Fe-4S protein TcuB [Varibaculum cambriense]|uniref:tricarballylate utilization 4Fe-4S protein TcuB n=1 Tax=Varibaculum cambriense TaxID=184870 RepID=UPI00241CB311|nr:tricarballylate utilization 4Fe-4S protein TcuB [Varibaculum cambriense]MBS5962839.1 tricarballylate utilization 4Fe-4S protein TcuB [Varibaculum cambriense]